jgi:hypothetical protein
VTDEDAWYSHLRARWRPSKVRLLLVGESAPAATQPAEERRFFYAPILSRADNLFRGVVAALYSDTKLTAGQEKEPWLQRLMSDGVWLIDLVPYPVNKLSPGERRRALRDNVPRCLDTVADVRPAGVIVCHGPSFEALAPALMSAKQPLLHDARIPFPLGNHRAEFVRRFREAVGNLPPRVNPG